MKKQSPPVKQRKSPGRTVARWGYYSTSIQKVVKKWQPVIGEHWCKHYLPECVLSVLPSSHGIHVNLAVCPGPHLKYVIELLAATNAVWNDNTKPDAHLLRFCDSGRYNAAGLPTLYSIKELRKAIKLATGISYTENDISQRIKRLRLNDKNDG